MLARPGSAPAAPHMSGGTHAGDVRMGLAEDANKVRRIAAGSGAALRQMYSPTLLQDAVPGLRIGPGPLLRRPSSPAAVAAAAEHLPAVCPPSRCCVRGTQARKHHHSLPSTGRALCFGAAESHHACRSPRQRI